ncbi:outer membrane protein transport protein [Salipiger pacificus]|uniref:Outer membrane protein transport protein n=2 Tax=Salipiger mangrovisoli TaxID=2865933 RepID=A0ABR9XA63_9RHOB|nr:outer membrane protein transport protein [Salipiger mangrovisoli]MBE9640500.1 outer membrane protein transport protein [Salipiger mangrovisoli]
MSECVKHSAIVAAGAVFALLPLSGGAHAAGFQLREMSAEGVGSAFSGSTAKATDLSTIYSNPAGMMRIPGARAQVDLNYVVPTIRFSGEADIAGFGLSGGNGGDAGENKLVPAFYGLFDLTPTVKAGISLTVPFGLATAYDEDWKGRYFAIESEIENIVLTPSIAWQATEKLSLGAGIQIGHADATLSSAINLSGLGLADAASELTGDGYGYGYTLGMLYEVSPTTRVGLSYRSKADYTLEGTAKITGVPDAYTAAIPALRSSDAEAEVTMPDVLSIGAYHEINPQWAVMGDVSWTNWSTFDELRVKFDDGRPDDVTDENWEDSWFVALGADYKPRDKHTIHFGVAYDQSPVPDDHRTARIPDADRYWASLGYSYEFGPDRTINVGYTHIFFNEADLEETKSFGTATGTLKGSYEGHADILSASLTYRF